MYLTSDQAPNDIHEPWISNHWKQPLPLSSALQFQAMKTGTEVELALSSLVLPHLLRLNTSPLHRGLDRDGTEFRGRKGCETSTKTANWRPNCADNHHLTWSATLPVVPGSR